MEERKLDRKVLEEQAVLLIDWNKMNIDKEPEQVRKNIETVVILMEKLNKYPSQ